MEHHEKFVHMTTYPVEKLVGRLAIPTIITMLVTAFYNMADTFFVGQLNNTSATGAVGVVFSFMAIIQAVGFFFGQGSGNAVSRLLGQERTEEAEHMAAVGFFSAFVGGLLIAVLGLCFLEPLARMLGSTETILPYAKEYLGIILVGAPFMTSSLVLNNLMRYQGNAFFSMLGIGTGAVLNVALDPLFIFTFHMGVSGAALATVLSQLVGFSVLLFSCTRRDNLRIRLRQFRPKWQDYRAVLQGGFPTLCRQGLSSVSTIVLNLVAGFCGGDAAIAAMTVASKVTHFAFSAVLGFGQGFQPVCGFNYGAGKYDRVKRAFWFCVRFATAFLVVASIAGAIFAPRLAGLFSHDPEVVRLGAITLRLQCISFPLTAWITLSTMFLQNIGKVGRASFLSMARQGIFFIPLALMLPRLLPLVIPGVVPMLGLQLAQPLADVITFAAAIPLCGTVLNTMGALKEN